MINRKFENYHETSHNSDAVIGFYDAKQLFYDHCMEKMYVLIITRYNNSHFFVEDLRKKMRPNCTSFSFEILSSARGTVTSDKKPKESRVKPPTAARQVTWNMAHSGAHQRAYLI